MWRITVFLIFLAYCDAASVVPSYIAAKNEETIRFLYCSNSLIPVKLKTVSLTVDGLPVHTFELNEEQGNLPSESDSFAICTRYSAFISGVSSDTYPAEISSAISTVNLRPSLIIHVAETPSAPLLVPPTDETNHNHPNVLPPALPVPDLDIPAPKWSVSPHISPREPQTRDKNVKPMSILRLPSITSDDVEWSDDEFDETSKPLTDIPSLNIATVDVTKSIQDPAPLIVRESQAHKFRFSAQDTLVWAPQGPKITDVVQGMIGNCFMVQPLMAIANKAPNIIKKNIRVVDPSMQIYEVTLYDPSNNFFAVRIYVDPSYFEIFTAGEYQRRSAIPAVHDGKTIIWPLLYEKAMVALLDKVKQNSPKFLPRIVGNPGADGYGMCSKGGQESQMLAVLTGKPYDRKKVSEMTTDDMQQRVGLLGEPQMLTLMNFQNHQAFLSQFSQAVKCFMDHHTVPLLQYDRLKHRVEIWCDILQQSYWIPMNILKNAVDSYFTIAASHTGNQFLFNPLAQPLEMSYGHWEKFPTPFKPNSLTNVPVQYRSVPWTDPDDIISSALQYIAQSCPALIENSIYYNFQDPTVFECTFTQLQDGRNNALVLSGGIDTIVVNDEFVVAPDGTRKGDVPYVIEKADFDSMKKYFMLWIARKAIAKMEEYNENYTKMSRSGVRKLISVLDYFTNGEKVLVMDLEKSIDNFVPVLHEKRRGIIIMQSKGNLEQCMWKPGGAYEIEMRSDGRAGMFCPRYNSMKIIPLTFNHHLFSKFVFIDEC